MNFDTNGTPYQKFTETFGSQWWEHAVFVLTYGNALEGMLEDEGKYVEQAFKEILGEWASNIQNALRSARVPKDVFSKIPVSPAGHARHPNLPGCKYWLSALWCTVFSRTSKTSKLALFRLNEHRLKRRSDVTREDFRKGGFQQPIVVDEGMRSMLTLPVLTGAGTAMGGAVVGAGIGATIGAAGLGVGAVVGAVAGGAIGASVGLLVHMWQVHESKDAKSKV